ncbi:MAG TPA: hypothetical protein PLD84_06200 [Chitinophagales bacterium]|nr:hypothetical protein [Chitinophagales bacterium]
MQLLIHQKVTLTFAGRHLIKLIAHFKGYSLFAVRKKQRSITIREVFHESLNIRWEAIDFSVPTFQAVRFHPHIDQSITRPGVIKSHHDFISVLKY